MLFRERKKKKKTPAPTQLRSQSLLSIFLAMFKQFAKGSIVYRLNSIAIQTAGKCVYSIYVIDIRAVYILY